MDIERDPETGVPQQNVSNLADRAGFEVEFEGRRGVRVVHGAALEKRSSLLAERGFESHPLRHY